MEKSCKRIDIYDEEKKISEAKLYKVSNEFDLALIKSDLKSKYYARFRMTNNYKAALLPSIEEHVHTVGFPEGKLEPRGGFVKMRSDPRYGKSGFTVGLDTEPGASGSPVYDNNALLLGIIWGKSDIKDRGYNLYALSADAIFPFLINSKVPVGTSSLQDAPKNKTNLWVEAVGRVLNVSEKIVVKIVCIN